MGNLYKEGKRLKDNELLKIKDSIRYIHIKDYSFSENRYTVLGNGDINYKKHVSLINTAVTTDNLFYSMETHVSKDNKYNDSLASFYKLREILGNRRVKYGIVGCGRVFRKHTLAIKEDRNSELVGVFDVDKNKMLKEVKNNDCLYYDSLYDLISDVDVINICTPHYTHTKIINKVLEGGKKCLCEKPGCINKEDAKRVTMNRAYKDNVFVVYQNRFNKPVLELEKVIKKNKLGNLLYVFGNVRWFRERSYYLNSWQGKRKLEGGILFNQGIHIIDIIMRFFKPGEKVKIISSFKDKIYHKNIDTEDLFLIQFKSGKTVYNLEINVSVLPCNLESNILFIFEKGRIRIGGLSLNEFFSIHIEGKDVKNLQYYENGGKDVYGYGHKVLIKKISEYVLTGVKDGSLVNFDEACSRVKFVNHLYKRT